MVYHRACYTRILSRDWRVIRSLVAYLISELTRCTRTDSIPTDGVLQTYLTIESNAYCWHIPRLRSSCAWWCGDPQMPVEDTFDGDSAPEELGNLWQRDGVRASKTGVSRF